MGEQYRLLLADDEQIERMALAKRLRRHFDGSLDIKEAVNGAEALELFQREAQPHCDHGYIMPEMNGVEAAERIRALDEDCIIIFLTAYDEFSYAKRAIVIRALDYLLKPCEEEELAAVMEEAMRRIQRRRQFEELNRSCECLGEESRKEEVYGAEFKDEADMEEPDRLGQAAEKFVDIFRKTICGIFLCRMRHG